MNDDPASPETDAPRDETDRVVVTGPLVVIGLIALLLGVAAGILSATKAVAP